MGPCQHSCNAVFTMDDTRVGTWCGSYCMLNPWASNSTECYRAKPPQRLPPIPEVYTITSSVPTLTCPIIAARHSDFRSRTVHGGDLDTTAEPVRLGQSYPRHHHVAAMSTPRSKELDKCGGVAAENGLDIVGVQHYQTL